MKHFILTSIQKDKLLQAKTLVQDKLDAKHIDLDPIEMNDGNFCLPIEVLEDFIELKEELSILPVKNVLPDDIKNNIII